MTHFLLLILLKFKLPYLAGKAKIEIIINQILKKMYFKVW